jgi:hypothetical protein
MLQTACLCSIAPGHRLQCESAPAPSCRRRCSRATTPSRRCQRNAARPLSPQRRAADLSVARRALADAAFTRSPGAHVHRLLTAIDRRQHAIDGNSRPDRALRHDQRVTSTVLLPHPRSRGGHPRQPRHRRLRRIQPILDGRIVRRGPPKSLGTFSRSRSAHRDDVLRRPRFERVAQHRAISARYRRAHRDNVPRHGAPDQ